MLQLLVDRILVTTPTTSKLLPLWQVRAAQNELWWARARQNVQAAVFVGQALCV